MSTYSEKTVAKLIAFRNFAAQIEHHSLFCSSPFGVLMA